MQTVVTSVPGTHSARLGGQADQDPPHSFHGAKPCWGVERRGQEGKGVGQSKIKDGRGACRQPGPGPTWGQKAGMRLLHGTPTTLEMASPA